MDYRSGRGDPLNLSLPIFFILGCAIALWLAVSRLCGRRHKYGDLR